MEPTIEQVSDVFVRIGRMIYNADVTQDSGTGAISLIGNIIHLEKDRFIIPVLLSSIKGNMLIYFKNKEKCLTFDVYDDRIKAFKGFDEEEDFLEKELFKWLWMT